MKAQVQDDYMDWPVPAGPICEMNYSPRPDGLCGNDDCGQMSAWYLRSVLGATDAQDSLPSK